MDFRYLAEEWEIKREKEKTDNNIPNLLTEKRQHFGDFPIGHQSIHKVSMSTAACAIDNSFFRNQ